MSDHPLDAPIVVNRLFYPRKAERGTSVVPNTVDGTVVVDEANNIEIGYRMYQPAVAKTVILFFHGNGEVASDYDMIAGQFLQLDTILIIADYRGYGWSTGTPLTSKMLPDAEAIANALPEILGDHASLPRIIMGRSLGSASAIYLAHTMQTQFKALILDSAFAEVPSILRLLGMALTSFSTQKMPVENAKRMESIHLPLLVIHGEEDSLLPIHNGEKLYNASPATDKTFLRVPQAGHNNVMYYAGDNYFNSINALITKAIN